MRDNNLRSLPDPFIFRISFQNLLVLLSALSCSGDDTSAARGEVCPFCKETMG